MSVPERVLNTEQIKEIIPHGDQFRFVGSVEELEPGKSAVGSFVDVRQAEFAYLADHFPGNQVIPGTILLEALEQLGAIAVLSLPSNRDKNAYVAGVEKLKFRNVTFPGEDVRLEVTIDRLGSKFGKGHGQASVEGKIRVEGEIIFAIVNK